MNDQTLIYNLNIIIICIVVRGMIEKTINRIGSILIYPRKTIDLLVVEDTNFLEGILVSTLALLGFSISLFVLSTGQSSFPIWLLWLFSFAFILVSWILFVFLFHKVTTGIYKVPGIFQEFYTISSYSLSTVILPLIIVLIDLLIFGSVEMIPLQLILLQLGLGIIWFVWMLSLFGISAMRYYRIDVKQFLVSLIISLTILFLIVIPLIVFFALTIFQLTMHFQITILGGVL